jgi:hypothetical protein
MKQLLLCMAMTRCRYKRYKRFWLIDEGDDVGMQMELFLKKQLLEASMAAWHDDRSTYLFMYCIVASIQITHDKEHRDGRSRISSDVYSCSERPVLAFAVLLRN